MALEVDIKKKINNFQLNVRFSTNQEVMGLFGPSGCGKSLTLKCIAGIEKPDVGNIILNGKILFDSDKKINLPPQKRKVGYLFQSYALFPHMNVKDNIRIVIKNKSEREKILSDCIRSFYLEDFADRYPLEISGGQQQRAALARIFASKPEIILLDEPFSALDGFLKWQLEQELMNVLKNYSGNSIFVSHSGPEVYRLCNTVSVMEDGMSQNKVFVKNLFNNPETISAALLTGCKNFSDIKIISKNKIFATHWGELLTVSDVNENHRFISIRSEHLKIAKEKTENSFPCKVHQVIEDVENIILILIPLNSKIKGDYSKLHLEFSKGDWKNIKTDDTIWVQASSSQIMLLK